MKAHDSKSCNGRSPFVGSNPTLSANIIVIKVLANAMRLSTAYNA